MSCGHPAAASRVEVVDGVMQSGCWACAVEAERPPKWDSWLPEDERLPEAAWVALPDPDWSVPALQPRCRYGSPHYGFCGQPTVATLFRGRRRRPYSYCADHLYGRWVEGSEVLNWTILPEFRRVA